MDLIKMLASLIPEDPEVKAGLGPLTLPDRCKWMEPVFEYHDNYYVIGPAIGMRLSEIDARVFKGLSIAATQPELDWMEQCHRIRDVCRYWPIMRSAGHYLFARNFKPITLTERK